MILKRVHSAVVPFLVGAAIITGVGSALAQDGTTPPVPEGITREQLGSGGPSLAPDRVLLIQRRTFAPGSDSGAHPAPGPVVLYVESGAIDFAVDQGAAFVTRSEYAGTDTPAETEPVPAGTEVTLNEGDSVFYDEGVVHTVRNTGGVDAVTLEARLNPADAS